MIATTRWEPTPAKQPPRDQRREELEQVYMALQANNAEQSACIIRQARRIALVEMEREHWRANAVWTGFAAIVGWAMFGAWLVRAWL